MEKDKSPNRDENPKYSISRVELMERLGYKSTNRKPFKQALLAMQDIKAQWDVLGIDNETNGVHAYYYHISSVIVNMSILNLSKVLSLCSFNQRFIQILI